MLILAAILSLLGCVYASEWQNPAFIQGSRTSTSRGIIYYVIETDHL